MTVYHNKINAKIPVGSSNYDSMWELKQKRLINFKTFMYTRVFSPRDCSNFFYSWKQRRGTEQGSWVEKLVDFLRRNSEFLNKARTPVQEAAVWHQTIPSIGMLRDVWLCSTTLQNCLLHLCPAQFIFWSWACARQYRVWKPLLIKPPIDHDTSPGLRTAGACLACLLLINILLCQAWDIFLLSLTFTFHSFFHYNISTDDSF